MWKEILGYLLTMIRLQSNPLNRWYHTTSWWKRIPKKMEMTYLHHCHHDLHDVMVPVEPEFLSACGRWYDWSRTSFWIVRSKWIFYRITICENKCSNFDAVDIELLLLTSFRGLIHKDNLVFCLEFDWNFDEQDVWLTLTGS